MRNDSESAARRGAVNNAVYRGGGAVRPAGGTARVSRVASEGGNVYSAGGSAGHGKTTVYRARDTRSDEVAIVEGRGRIDWIAVILMFILLALGTVTVLSASYPTAISEGRSTPYYYVIRQLAFIAVGFVLMLVAAVCPPKLHYISVTVFAPLSVVLLLLVQFIGRGDGAEKRWIKIADGATLQPTEFAKYVLVLLLAFYYNKYADSVKNADTPVMRYVRGILIPGGFLAVYVGFAAWEKHLSCIVILGLIGYCTMLAGGARFLPLTVTAGTVGFAAFKLFTMSNKYAADRASIFNLDPSQITEEMKRGPLWQNIQGQYAIGSGGLFGLGLGNSRQKYNYVSEPQNDFIFTIWCEEMGFFGAVALILLFVALIWRGYVIALRSRDNFSRILAFGITSKIAIQFILNIAVVTGIIPNTGISLPFFSYGGSALVIQMAEMGVLFSVSRNSVMRRG